MRASSFPPTDLGEKGASHAEAVNFAHRMLRIPEEVWDKAKDLSVAADYRNPEPPTPKTDPDFWPYGWGSALDWAGALGYVGGYENLPDSLYIPQMRLAIDSGFAGVNAEKNANAAREAAKSPEELLALEEFFGDVRTSVGEAASRDVDILEGFGARGVSGFREKAALQLEFEKRAEQAVRRAIEGEEDFPPEVRRRAVALYESGLSPLAASKEAALRFFNYWGVGKDKAIGLANLVPDLTKAAPATTGEPGKAPGDSPQGPSRWSGGPRLGQKKTEAKNENVPTVLVLGVLALGVFALTRKK